MLYPQNGDRTVTIDSVTSSYPMYRLRIICRGSQCNLITGNNRNGHRRAYRSDAIWAIRRVLLRQRAQLVRQYHISDTWTVMETVAKLLE